MGLFFEQRKPDPRLVELFQNALETSPHQASTDQTATLLGDFKPLADPLGVALRTPTQDLSSNAAAIANARAADVTDELLGGTTFNTGRFVVALAIFLALLGGAVATDAANLKNSPAALYALATTVFGVVVGFLGSEKP